jgi:hypothetical protein
LPASPCCTSATPAVDTAERRGPHHPVRLVAPLFETGTFGRDVYLPPGNWID